MEGGMAPGGLAYLCIEDLYTILRENAQSTIVKGAMMKLDRLVAELASLPPALSAGQESPAELSPPEVDTPLVPHQAPKQQKHGSDGAMFAPVA